MGLPRAPAPLFSRERPGHMRGLVPFWGSVPQGCGFPQPGRVTGEKAQSGLDALAPGVQSAGLGLPRAPAPLFSERPGHMRGLVPFGGPMQLLMPGVRFSPTPPGRVTGEKGRKWLGRLAPGVQGGQNGSAPSPCAAFSRASRSYGGWGRFQGPGPGCPQIRPVIGAGSGCQGPGDILRGWLRSS
jgi:hypothetical protein